MPRFDITDDVFPAKSSKWVVFVSSGKTNYRYELLDGGTVNVFKLEDALTPTYVIKRGICSCPAAMHGKRCKHVSTVHYEPAG